MLQDLQSTYKKALKRVEDGELHVVNVSIFENKTVLVLHEDKMTKEVTVVDTTGKPEENWRTVKHYPDKSSAPEKKAKEAVQKVKQKRNPLACKYCGKVCKSKSGKTRHEKKCPQKGLR